MQLTSSWRTRFLASALIVAMCVALAPLAVPAAEAAEPAVVATDPSGPIVITPAAERIFGADRVATNVELVQSAWESSEYVVLATARDYPDALVGAPLAGAYDAPLLLTEPGALSPEAAREIERLGATDVILLGGEGALSANVVAGVTALGIASDRVERIAGANRYETAGLVADRVIERGGVKDWTVIATGENFPDALAISPWAARLGVPILLTTSAELPAPTLRVLDEHESDTTLVVGGEGVVPDALFDRLPDPYRIAGEDRYETATRIAEFSAAYGFTYDDVYVTTGLDYPDSLSAGPVGGRLGRLLVLTRPDVVPPAVDDFFMSHCSGIDEHDGIHAVGGPSVVSEAVVDELISASETILSGDIVHVDGALETAVTEVTDGKVVFDNSGGAADDVVVGSVLVSSEVATEAPTGMLRRVTNVSEAGGARTATTEEADLTDVIKKGSLDVAQIAPADVLEESDHDDDGYGEASVPRAAPPFDPSAVARMNPDGVAPAWDAHMGYNHAWDVPIYKKNGFDVHAQTQLNIDAWLHINISFDWWTLREAECYFHLSETLDVTTIATLTGEIDTGDIRIPGTPEGGYWLGGYDVFDLVVAKISADVYLEPMVGFKGSFEGTASTGFTQSASFQLGFGYEEHRGFYPMNDGSASFTWKPLEIDAHGHAKAWLGGRVWVRFCGSPNGVYVQPNGFLEADATLATENLQGGLDWELDAGSEVKIGGHVGILGFNKDFAWGPYEISRAQLAHGHLDI